LKVGAPIRRKTPEKFFWGHAPRLFGSKSTISRLGKRFRGDQYTLISFLFVVLLLTVSPCAQPFVKVGGVPPVPHGVGATGGIAQCPFPALKYELVNFFLTVRLDFPKTVS